jgi:outer membrane protein assembly factor BamD
MKIITRNLSIALLASSLLAGCSSNPKDEKYNEMAANEIYQQGVKHTHKNRFNMAVEDFEALEARYPFGEYADKAQLGAIYAHYLGEEYTQALPATDRFLRMYPRHPNVDYAYFMKGLIHFSEAVGFFSKYLPMERAERDPNPGKKALASFEHLVSHYPNSAYVENAKQRMIYLRNLVAENELYVARFYLRKGAYLAAATRSNYLLVHFDQAPQTEEALSIMVQAYRALDFHDLASDAFFILRHNFPQSEFVTKLA